VGGGYRRRAYRPGRARWRGRCADAGEQRRQWPDAVGRRQRQTSNRGSADDSRCETPAGESQRNGGSGSKGRGRRRGEQAGALKTGLPKREIRVKPRAKRSAESGPHSVGISATNQELFPGNSAAGQKVGAFINR